jgi:hypothetical protein
LISREDKAEYEVNFEFHVSSEPTPGVPQMRRITIWGEVTTSDNIPLPEGRYLLHVSSGETLQVENTGLTGWRVVPTVCQHPTGEDLEGSHLES